MDLNRLKSYLKSQSDCSNISYHYGYNYYFLRQFLERIQQKRDSGFVLSGSFGRFVQIGSINRPLTDLDFISTLSSTEIYDLLQEEIVINPSDFIKFTISKFQVTNNNTVDLVVLCEIDKIRHVIRADIKSSSFVGSQKVLIPSLFCGDYPFPVNSLSYNELVASKLFSLYLKLVMKQIQSASYIRYKDFYDWHSILATSFSKPEVQSIFHSKIEENHLMKELGFPKFPLDFLDSKFVLDQSYDWNCSKKHYNIVEDVEFSQLVEEARESFRRFL